MGERPRARARARTEYPLRTNYRGRQTRKVLRYSWRGSLHHLFRGRRAEDFWGKRAVLERALSADVAAAEEGGMLSLLLAPCPSAAGGAGRGRPEAACAGVDECDWVATWGCSNDDGSDGFRCRSMLTSTCWSLRAVRTIQPHVCCTYRRRRAACPRRGATVRTPHAYQAPALPCPVAPQVLLRAPPAARGEGPAVRVRT